MGDPMQIREVTKDELNSVLALIDQFNRPISPRPSSDLLQGILESIRLTGGTVVGAFEQEEIVGTCTVNLCANLSWSGRPYAIIENVIVDSNYRRQGVGSALLLFARNFAQNAGCYKVALMTGSKRLETMRFYENAGFVGNKTGFQARFSD
jgi:GNAT superfamily N-acetyltransferase